MLIPARPLTPDRTRRLPSSPLGVLCLLAVLLFLLEISVMFALNFMTGIAYELRALMDASILVAGIFPALYFFVFRPLTQQIACRRQAQEELRQAHAELEQRVLERTTELAAANTTLHEMHQRLQDFIRGVTHDLRTPLTGILGHSQLLSRCPDHRSERCQKSAEAIACSAKRMKVLIQDLVDSVLLEAGELNMLRQPVALRAFVANLLESLGPLMDVSRVRLELSPDLPLVEADPQRLERIYINLLTNALKYSPPESEVLVKAERADGEVTTAVVDHGAGIAPEDLPLVFERFCKLRHSQQAGGLGLGLFVTKMLVEAHRGRIWADSKVGEGASFRFTLPVA